MERKRKITPLIGLLLLCFVLFIIIRQVTQKTKASTVISPVPEISQDEPTLINRIFARKKNPEDLRKKIQSIVDNRFANYSVLVIDYTSDFSLSINDSIIYTAASVNKIPILAALYTKAEQGKIDLDTRVTIQQKDIQDYGTGSIRYDEPGSTYSVKTLAKLMIQQSDNTAAYVLANYTIGLDVIAELTKTWGLTQTDMFENKTSNKDIAIVMGKIYKGEIASQSNTAEMLAFFKDTDFEDRLPALLPKEAIVYHKIGNEVGILHDVGIVEHGPTKYYIGILISDAANEQVSIQTMSQISKAVYDYMKR